MSDLLPKLSPLFTSCVALRDSGVLGAMKQQAFWRRVPEGNLVKPQPFYQLCKLAKGSAREHGDVRACFTHARYAFSQKATRETNNKQPCLSVCAFDCDAFIKVSKWRFAAALVWSEKMQGFNAASPSCLLSCLHPWYAPWCFQLFVYMQIYLEDTIKDPSFSCSFHLKHDLVHAVIFFLGFRI